MVAGGGREDSRGCLIHPGVGAKNSQTQRWESSSGPPEKHQVLFTAEYLPRPFLEYYSSISFFTFPSFPLYLSVAVVLRQDSLG